MESQITKVIKVYRLGTTRFVKNVQNDLAV